MPQAGDRTIFTVRGRREKTKNTIHLVNGVFRLNQLSALELADRQGVCGLGGLSNILAAADSDDVFNIQLGDSDLGLLKILLHNGTILFLK